jgi:hypothetical protein
MSDRQPLIGLGRELVELWDEFHFVGNSYDDRTIWAVGNYCGDIIVAEVKHPIGFRLMLSFILNAFY